LGGEEKWRQQKHRILRRNCIEKAYLLTLAAGFFAAVALTDFMGAPQHTNSHVSSHSHGFSTKTTRPQSSHSYFSPFFFAKKNHLLKSRFN
jgi:hypothetical protein